MEDRFAFDRSSCAGEGTPAIERATSADVADPAAAYRAFIEANLLGAYRLATFLLRDPSDAEDAVHDAAISAWRHWPDRREPARAEAWFRRIVVNACRDRMRRRGRIRLVAAPFQGDGDHPRIDDAEHEVGERDYVARALADLNDDERTVVVLRFGLDLTVPAIAAGLGLREGTVKSRLHRALSSLRVTLSADPEDRR